MYVHILYNSHSLTSPTQHIPTYIDICYVVESKTKRYFTHLKLNVGMCWDENKYVGKLSRFKQ